MSNLAWPIVLVGISVGLIGPGALASETASVQLAQTTSVHELSDVSPDDWAYEALQDLVEKWRCLEGYPDQFFRGNEPISRYEFVAGLHSCLDLIVGGLYGEPIDDGPFAHIRRLQQEFQAELALFGNQTAALRDQQFSTTTKLHGQVDAHVVLPFSDTDLGNDGIGDDDNTAFTARTQLNFDSSFTGQDRLRIRLEAGNDDNGLLATTTSPLSNLGLANSADGVFNVAVDEFYYRFPAGDRLDITLAANGLEADDLVTSTIVPFDAAVAEVGNPTFYDIGVGNDQGGAAGAINLTITDQLIWDVGYVARNSNAANPGGSNNANLGGLFGAAGQQFFTQLNLLPDAPFNGALVYLHSSSGGSQFANTYGGLVSLDVGPVIVGGYYAYIEGDGLFGSTATDADAWQVGIVIPDFLSEGSQLGLYYTELPQGDGNPHVIEGYYEIPINEFLTVTPAVIYGDLDTAGVSNTDNVYGVLRAAFQF